MKAITHNMYHIHHPDYHKTDRPGDLIGYDELIHAIVIADSEKEARELLLIEDENDGSDIGNIVEAVKDFFCLEIAKTGLHKQVLIMDVKWG